MEDERRWDELEDDCLLNIFGRVDMESLLLDVPFVCKSWHKATLDPLCWQNLIFPDLDSICSLRQRCEDEYYLHKFPKAAFVKFIISRSKGKAVTLRLPQCASEDVLKYAADECSSLIRTLQLPSRLLYKKSSIILELIMKWTNLEHLALGCSFELDHLTLGRSFELERFLEQISIHCKNLCCFSMEEDAYINQDHANAIIKYLPNLKQLILKGIYIERGALVTLILGCRELVQLDVSNCVGFDKDDEEITRLASHIAIFCSQGSAVDYYEYDDDVSAADAIGYNGSD